MTKNIPTVLFLRYIVLSLVHDSATRGVSASELANIICFEEGLEKSRKVYSVAGLKAIMKDYEDKGIFVSQRRGRSDMFKTFDKSKLVTELTCLLSKIYV